MTATLTAKNELLRLANHLSDDATWDDVLYEINATREIEAGLNDCREARLVSLDEVRKRLGIPE
ncbi:MAG: hypothetical protein EXS09_18880 [Gemmataceae bacterium]|nr:hypothetical protein [Gemmataceae bacterium]